MWLAWALAAATSVQLAPNPIYVAVVIAIAMTVVAVNTRRTALSAAFPIILGVAGLFAVLRVLLTVITTHGTGDVLLRLPAGRLPTILGGFVVGGTVEAQVLARAAAESFALVGMLAAFGAFNAVVSHYELVESAPRAFHELGLAVIVALSFVPATVASITGIREADRARTGGRVVRRGRLLRQLVPLLATGMERATALSESMDARGFGYRRATRPDRLVAVGTAAALVALAAALVALIGRATAVAFSLATAGAGLLLVVVVASSRASSRTRYRSRHLGPRGIAIAAATWVGPVILIALTARNDPSLLWPGPRLGMPTVSAVAVAALAALALPAFVVSDRAGEE